MPSHTHHIQRLLRFGGGCGPLGSVRRDGTYPPPVNRPQRSWPISSRLR